VILWASVIWLVYWHRTTSASPPVELTDRQIAILLVSSLQLRVGERVLIPHDPGYFDELIRELEREVRAAGAVPILTEWSLKGQPRPSAPLRELLEGVDVFFWSPFRTSLREVTPAEAKDIARWTDRGGHRRQIHFHWDQGSVEADGLPGEHTPALDRLYRAALRFDRAILSRRQQAAARLLARGTVRVTTPAGTDLRFEIRSRPFNRQDGTASRARMARARVRVDREVEFPGGVLRVAPVEETVNGTVVVPEARFGGQRVRELRLTFRDGKVESLMAREGLAAVQSELSAAGEAAFRFREFGLGCHPGLRPLPGSKVIPYFGYGAGIVRLSLGDNEELGGSVRGGYRRWFFFPDATVVAGAARQLVSAGRLNLP